MIWMDILTLGPLETNCYLVKAPEARTCVVIDPGDEPEIILSRLEGRGLTPEAILLTHGHFDHVGAVKSLAARYGCPVYLHPADLQLPPDLTAGPLAPTDRLGEGQVLYLAGLDFQVLHTPGHTPGSVCLLTAEAMFSGDTLFAGSCGRTDLPGGSWGQMRQSLSRLNGLDFQGAVYPGHGEATTLMAERRCNPYLSWGAQA